MTARTWSEIMLETFESIDKLGWNETFGLSPNIDGPDCECGGGCESPIECRFWMMMRKTDLVERGCARQVWLGGRRVDCLCECGDKLVVVELDGKDWHKDFEAEQRRDTELLAHVDAIIHVPGAAIYWFPEAVFCVLAAWYSRFVIESMDTFCISADDFRAELDDDFHPNSQFASADEFVEWAEPNYEIWQDCDGMYGKVGTPKAFIQEHRKRPLLIGRTMRA